MKSPENTATLYVRLPVNLNDRLQAHLKSTGESKTDMVIAALTEYLRKGENHDSATGGNRNPGQAQ